MPQIKQGNESLPERLIPVGLIFIIDILLTCLSFAASYAICASFFPGIVQHRFVLQMPIIIAITSLIFLTIGIYKRIVHYDRLRQVYSIFNAICFANILTIVFAVVNGKLIMEEDLVIPLSIILVHSFISFIALVASRYLYKQLLVNIKERLVRVSNVALIHNFDDDAAELNQFSSVLEEGGKKPVLKVSFFGDRLNNGLDYSAIQDNYIDAFVLLYKESTIPSFSEALEKLAKFKKPIYFAYAANVDKGHLTADNIKLHRLDLFNLFAPQINFKRQLGSVKSSMDNSSVLVTGAGGTIAKEYIRAMLDMGFRGKLLLLDNSETALNGISAYCQTFKNVKIVPKLGDVKEMKLVKKIFEEHRPNYVLHAAGNNKPEFLDDNIINVFKENILATKVVADISAQFKVKRFVFCSNKEAERPSTTLEVCKRISEMYLDSLNTQEHPFNYVSLRLNKVFDPDNSFINYLQWQIDLGRKVNIKRFGSHKIFSNKKDVANALIHVMSAQKLPGSLLKSNLGLKVRTSILVDFMTSLGIQKEMVDYEGKRLDTVQSQQPSNTPAGVLSAIFDKPPLESVSGSNGLSKEYIQKTVETIYLNILLNSKEYPEVFTLITDFGPGYWKDLFDAYRTRRSDKDVIHLGQ